MMMATWRSFFRMLSCSLGRASAGDPRVGRVNSSRLCQGLCSVGQRGKEAHRKNTEQGLQQGGDQTEDAARARV